MRERGSRAPARDAFAEDDLLTGFLLFSCLTGERSGESRTTSARTKHMMQKSRLLFSCLTGARRSAAVNRSAGILPAFAAAKPRLRAGRPACDLTFAPKRAGRPRCESSLLLFSCLTGRRKSAVMNRRAGILPTCDLTIARKRAGRPRSDSSLLLFSCLTGTRSFTARTACNTCVLRDTAESKVPLLFRLFNRGTRC
jgi:hypothetical protein